MTIQNLRGLVNAELDGAVRNYTWRKTPSQTTVAGYWFDLSMSPGNPGPKYWFDAPPGVAKVITRTDDGGLPHGPNVSPSVKYLRALSGVASAATALPMPAILCDYLLYYPSIDEGTTDVQPLTNTATLSRYTDGANVQILAVSVAPRAAKDNFTVSYTNSDGVAGRTTNLCWKNLQTATGLLQCGNGLSNNDFGSPFLSLQAGDTGVRSIESVTMSGVDTGLISLILVRPLAWWGLRETGCPYEKDFYISGGQLPEIKDDAFLNFICIPNGSLAATVLTGNIKVIWS